MAGVKSLRKIQLGDETVAGTPVAATAVWRGMGTGQDIREVIVPDEDIGRLLPSDRSFVGAHSGQIEFEETPATYEQIAYLFEAGIESETATQDGTGSDYIYQYNFPNASQNTTKTYTIEFGDDQQAYEADYGHVTELTINGSATEAINNSATWMTRNPTTTTYTAALSAPAADTILFQNLRLYIDGTGTYPATTQITNSIIGFEYNYTTGVKAQWTGDGDKDFSFTKKIRPEGTLTITLEHDGNAVTEWGNFRSDTTRNVRLEVTGPAVETAGTTYSNKMLILDFCGRYTEVSGLDDDDGNDIIELTLQQMYNSTDDTPGRIIVVNELSALP